MQGISLIEKFYIKTEPWISDFGLEYAFGIIDSNLESKRLTDYLASPTTTTILPFLNQPLKIVIFVKDPFENVYTSVSDQSVTMFQYNGTLSAEDLTSNFTQTQKIIALLDQSSSLGSSLNNQIIDSINITGANSLASLKNLEQITTSVSNNKDVMNKVVSKIDSFLADINLGLKNNSNPQLLSTNQTQSIMNVVSNLYSSQGSSSAQNLINNLAFMLVASGTNNSLAKDATSLPAISFSTPSFSVSVSSFNPANLTQSKYMSQSMISADLSEIFNSSSSQKASVTLIKYTADKSLSPVPFEKLDVKFFSANSMMNVSGLSKPIMLKFTFNNSLISSIQNSDLSCKYYDELTGTWNTNGCTFSSIDYTNGFLYCACTHTTLFSVRKF